MASSACTNTVSNSDLKLYPIIFVGYMVSCWVLHKLLVHVFKMYPLISDTASLQSPRSSMQEMDDLAHSPISTISSITEMNDLETNDFETNDLQMNDLQMDDLETPSKMTNQLTIRLSKRLDGDNKFRIRQKGSILFIKSASAFSMSFMSIYMFVDDYNFYIAHFWNLDSCSVNNIYLQYVSIFIISYYLWEIFMIDQYYNTTLPVYAHHFSLIICACLILSGIYNPFAVNHGVLLVSYVFIVYFMMGFRYNYCDLYPNLTRKLAHFAYWNYMFLLICCWSVDILIIIRLCTVGFTKDTVPIYNAVISFICIIIWGYVDYQLLQEIGKWRYDEYEDVQF